jgi:hypothetical protein
MEPEFPLQFSKIQNSSKRRFVVYVFPRETRSSGSNHRMFFFFANRESEVFLGVMWSMSVQSYFVESVTCAKDSNILHLISIAVFLIFLFDCHDTVRLGLLPNYWS